MEIPFLFLLICEDLIWIHIYLNGLRKNLILKN